jgi:hypothetical protein
MTDNDLCEQEVRELTDLLRNDPNWADLRVALTQRGFQQDQIMLAGFMEDENHNEWGVFVTTEGRVYQYERNTARRNPPGFEKLSQVDDIATTTRSFECVAVALRLLSKS